MTFTVKIKCDNAAFNDEDRPCAGPEVARILRKIADEVDGDDIRGDSWRLMDYNGNHVGEAKATTR